MKIRKFTYLNKKFQYTELPNGMRVVSGDVFADKSKKRKFEVCFAGGRLADIDPPGAALGFVKMIPNLLEEVVSKSIPKNVAGYSLEHGCMRMSYCHHGRDEQDVNCLSLLLESIMQHNPSVDTCLKIRNSVSSVKEDKTNGFWTWFYSKVSPGWQRMCIPTWTEAIFAEQVDYGNTIKYRDRIVHPLNALVCSSDSDLHSDLVFKLAELNANDMDAKRFVCKAPAVSMVHEEYPYANQSRKTLDLLFYIPLPEDRMMFLKTAFVFFAIFGNKGYLEDFLKREKIRLKFDTHLAFWPQPFAFIKVTVKITNVESVKAMIGLASVGFSSLEHAQQVSYLNGAVSQTEFFAANPFSVIRDEWLGTEDPKIGKEYFPFSFEGLKYLVMAYVSESRMGVIYGLPSLPRGVSIFSSI